MTELTCMYDGCEEQFEGHQERTAHSLREHWDIDPKNYPNISGEDYSWRS